MKTFASISIAFLAMIGAAFAQLPSQVTVDPANGQEGAVRDGFTLAGDQIMITKNGMTDKVLQQFDLPNGGRVYPSGEIRLPTGVTTRLLANQVLTLEGEIINVPVTSQGKALVPPQGAAATETAISSRDGVSISGTRMFVTRNGVASKMDTKMALSNGSVAYPDGTVLMTDGSKITLREDQLLGFDGVLRGAPVRESNSAVPRR